MLSRFLMRMLFMLLVVMNSIITTVTVMAKTAPIVGPALRMVSASRETFGGPCV